MESEYQENNYLLLPNKISLNNLDHFHFMN
jgi:hypothetical protein